MYICTCTVCTCTWMCTCIVSIHVLCMYSVQCTCWYLMYVMCDFTHAVADPREGKVYCSARPIMIDYETNN